MIIVDEALKKRQSENRPIRVGLIGAGFMARGIAAQIHNQTQGMVLSAVQNRHLDKAFALANYVGADSTTAVGSSRGLQTAMRHNSLAITDDPRLLASCGEIDVLVEASGAIEFAANVALAAIENGKPIVTMTAELDGTVGPILAHLARQANVVYSVSDGDQPGVQMNLLREVRMMGLRPLVSGNIKGLHDPYRTPTTQKAFAEKWGQSPYMVTSFADGTKISFEQAIVANAAGLTLTKRGMDGRTFDGHVTSLTEMYDMEQLFELGGIVDYFVGTQPAPGVFVLAAATDKRQIPYLDLYKMGPGPLYAFYRPYHLCHFEVAASIARAVLFRDVTLQATGVMRVEVVATSKRDLLGGETLDGLGGYMTYGLAETAENVSSQRLLPIGLALGARLKHDVPRDRVLSLDDVDLPKPGILESLRKRQSLLQS